MKILLTDDDHLIRFTIKSMLNDILPQECIFIEASNGREMINRCIDSDPDIAFVDISMPCLDGISAIEECKKISPYTEFVILTGYSDFNYAKKCISLGVADYILKPVSSDYLKTTIDTLSEKLAHSKARENAFFQLAVMNSLMNQELGKTEISSLILEQNETLAAFTFFIDCEAHAKLYHDTRNHLSLELKKIAGRYAVKNHYTLSYSPEGFLRFLLKISRDQMAALVQDLQAFCNFSSSDTVNIYSLYSQKRDIDTLLEECDKISQCQYMRIAMKKGEVTDIRFLDQNTSDNDFLQHLSSMISAYLEANENSYTKDLNYLYKTYHTEELHVNLKHISAFIKVTLGLDCPHDNIKSFFRYFVDNSSLMYQNADLQSGNKIDMILSYIESSYMNDISINQIADYFDLTPNYVSKLFHEKTGIRFIEYLTNLRITQAKKLLITNYTTPIKDIALMCGYYSSRHFSSTFKKLTGLYPTDHRRNFAPEQTEE